ncbi:hypothetical protein [Streptacidiphilus sp. EB103A]|uniref:hypothetical protein n=1 Tax=Streptacidiphilus sp. EB103A TaxID=3156275 RepID=UPI003513ED43
MIASQTLITASAMSSLHDVPWWVQLLAGLALLAGGLGLKRIAQNEQSSMADLVDIAAHAMAIGGAIIVLNAVV